MCPPAFRNSWIFANNKNKQQKQTTKPNNKTKQQNQTTKPNNRTKQQNQTTGQT